MAHSGCLTYPRTVAARGRNGLMKMVGIELLPFTGSPECQPYVSIHPITSRGLSDAAVLEVPIESIDELITKLQESKAEILEKTKSDSTAS